MSALTAFKRRLRPEARFITLCLREPDARTAGDLRAAASAPLDWDAILAVAGRHGVAGFVRRAAAREALALPALVERRLRDAEYAAVQQVMRLDVALVRVLNALAAGGVPAIVLKGPALARTIYPRPTLRPYSDVDLTVQEQHEEPAVDVLRAHGLRELVHEEEARHTHPGHVEEGFAFHRTFESADGLVLFELHLDPLQLGLRATCEAGRWARAHPVPGLPGALMLGPADQLVQLSLHAHKHGYSRLIWLKDLDLLLRAEENRIDWSLVLATARQEGVAASVWYTLHLAGLLLGAPVPREALARLAPAPPVRALYRLVWPVRPIADLEGHWRRRAVQFNPAEHWRGMLPSLLTMGRRRERARAIARAVLHR